MTAWGQGSGFTGRMRSGRKIAERNGAAISAGEVAIARGRVTFAAVAACAFAIAIALAAGAVAQLAPQAAFAVEGEADVAVWGAQTQFDPAQSAEGELAINVLDFSGAPGETVFLTVKDGADVQAKFLPHEVGQDAAGNSTSPSSAANAADAFTITVDAGEATEAKLRSGAYTVDVFLSRASQEADFTGTVYGVWATLADAADGEGSAGAAPVLIGTRTALDGAGTAFVAPATIFANGKTYELESDEPAGGASATAAGPLTYSYAEQGAQSDGSVDGVVKYIDKDGAVIATDTIAAIPRDGEKDFQIPAAVKANGKVYRTMALKQTVTARNPGQTSFVVACAEMTADDEAAANHYLAKISMVDTADGSVIVSDSVNVTGAYYYTAPDTIYKTLTDADGNRQVHTYVLKDAATVTLDPATDAAEVDADSRTRQVTFHYELQPLDELNVEVTFNWVNGQERATSGNTSRQLGTQQETVSADNPTARPQEQITVDGTTYNLAGSADAYAYEYGSGAVPVVNAYYVPEGYVAPGPYQVTVNYVDYASNQTVASETVMSSPDSISDLLITPPEQFTEGGITYKRLPGQEEPIAHNYYSNIAAYVVYYYDVDQPLEHEIIERVRVVYRDGGTTVLPGGAAAGAAGTGADGTAATTQAQLNANNTYNAVGDTLTNQGGVDANQERIDDEANPLASGLDEGEAAVDGNASGEGGAPFGLPLFVWPLLVVLLALAAGAAMYVRESRKPYGR